MEVTLNEDVKKETAKYSEEIEELSKRLKIRPVKVKYILAKYGSIEEFCKRYLSKKLDNEDKWKLRDNLKDCIDISCLNSRGLDLLFGELIKIKSNEGDYINVPFYYGNKLVDQLNRLQFREVAILANRFSLTSEEKLSQEEIGVKFSISHSRIYSLIKGSIEKLKNAGVVKKVSSAANELEELRLILESKFAIYDNIFYPDKEFEREEAKIFFANEKVDENKKLKLFNPVERKAVNVEEKKLVSGETPSLWDISAGNETDKAIIVDSLLNYINILDERIKDAEEKLRNKKDKAYNISRLQRFRKNREQAKEILSSFDLAH